MALLASSVPVYDQDVCQVELTPEQISKLKAQLEQLYMFEIFVDDLPVVKPIGFYLDETKQCVSVILKQI